ncbi:hypothetical protein MN116_002729 [Schistosoma mekongi]|uniref:A-kinase anchor protein 17A n=1 Tax=Schistosoma mekongi TaxID=38744 RepID=A0AAE2D6I6_SCHME|nr:hypothetical protein MN116_002729 [Schistosoma mekongi]
MTVSAQKTTEPSKISDLVDFCPALNLYLKPIARVCITVQIPLLHDTSGQLKSFTTWEIIEKIRQLCPGILSPSTVMKVVHTTLEFVRFAVDLENKIDVRRVVTSLESQFIKLSGFPQNLRVRASEAPYDCPRRHDWEAFFRDAQNMDETKSGERPDTLVLTGLPIRWFASASHNRPRFSVSSDDTSSSYLSFLVDDEKPNPLIVKEAFEVFGKVREIDIPMLDPSQNPDCLEDYINSSDVSNNSYDLTLKAESTLRNDSGCAEEYVGGFGKIGPDTIGVLNPAIQHCAINSSTDSGNQPKSCHLSKSKKSNILTSSTTNVGSPLTFIAYVQYMDYTGFSRAMDMLRGQKLVYAPTYRSQSSLLDQNEKLYYAAEIKIDFDRSKHLSPDSIHLRQIKRNQLLIVAERRRAEAKTIAEAERERLRLLEDSERKAVERREAEALAAEAERTAKRAAREESKRQIAIDRCKRIKEDLLKKKISLEDYRRIVAIRKVEGIRLMTFLLAKIQARHDLIVATRRLARISKAEKALADAEATANVVLSSTSQSNILTQIEVNDKLETGEKDESNKICSQSGLPPVNSSPESSPIEETEEQDSRFQQLLAKREEFLRNNLLRKRADVLRTKIYERSIMYNSSHSTFPEHRKRIQLAREKY